jgi:predicted RNA-binding Zn ribbon-like protein
MQPRIATLNLAGGHPALDLANTVSDRHGASPRDHLVGGYGDLVDWAEHAGLLDAAGAAALREAARADPAAAARAHARALDLRESVFAVFSAVAAGRLPGADALARLDRHVAEARPRLAPVAAPDGDGGPPRFARRFDEPPGDLDRIRRTAAWAAADLLTSDDRVGRLRECANEHCGWLFLDASKNGTRRWCDMRDCGSLAKMRRFRARRRHAPPAPSGGADGPDGGGDSAPPRTRRRHG